MRLAESVLFQWYIKQQSAYITCREEEKKKEKNKEDSYSKKQGDKTQIKYKPKL